MTLPIVHHMVDQARTKYLDTAEKPLAAGTAQVLEGMALIMGLPSPTGEEQATLCTGAGGEILVGMSIVNVVNVNKLPLVENLTVPTSAPFTATLQKLPLGGPTVASGGAAGGTLSLYESTGTLLTTPANYTISGNVITFVIAGPVSAGEAVTAHYAYEPTLNEVLTRFHQGSINFENANALLELVSVGRGVGSEVFTQQYNLQLGRFALGGSVRLGGSAVGTTNGQVVAAGTGVVVGVCIREPSADDPMLGFRLTV